MTTEAEDLAKLKAEKAKELETMFSCMDMLFRMEPEELKHSGHKTVQEAIFYTYRESAKKIAKAAANFIRKYPD